MNTTNWGIIGPGNIARDFARDLQYASSPQKVHAVLSHHWDSAQSYANEFGIKNVFTDLEEFIKNSNADIVYIATPHTLHFEAALACLNNKIPVLCEKPMTINATQCEALIEASQANNTFLMEGMWIRFLPSIKLLLEIIKNGTIGKLVSIKASTAFKAPYDVNNRFFDPELGGGSLLDLGIYPVFLSLLLLGKPDTIKAIGTLSDEGIDEACSMLFHYKKGQHATLESSLLSQTDLPAEIAGEKGMIKLLSPWYEKASGLELHLYDDGKIVYPCRWQGRGLQFEAEEAVACIKNNQISSDLLPHRFSRDIITVMDEVRDQIKVTYDMYE